MTKLSWGRYFTFRVFPHPWLHSGVLTARLGVLVSTLLWGVLAVSIDGAWTQSEYYQLEYVASENFWGWLFLVVAVAQTTRTYRHVAPNFVGFLLNASMAYLWTYITLDKLVVGNAVPISGFSACMVMMLASWWNLTSLPKRATWHGPKSPFIG